MDPSGRRRRFARVAGIVAGCLLAAYMVVVASGLLTGSGAPFTPWPGVTGTPRAAPPARGGVAPPGRSPSRRASPSPDPRPRPTRATASPRPSASARGHGHAFGLTKRPNPRKPTG